MRTLLFALCVAGLCNTCASGPGFLRKKNGNLTRRHLRLIATVNEKDRICEFVDIGAFFYESEKPLITPSAKRIVADLPEKPLVELLKQTGPKEAKSKDVVALLSEKIGTIPPPAEQDIIDLTRIEKRVVISVEDLLPGDFNRIMKVKANVKFSPRFRLLSCNRFETKYQTVDLGKLNFNRSFQAKVNANLGLQTTGTIVGSTDLTNGSRTGADEFNGDSSSSKRTGSDTQVTVGNQGVSAEAGTTRSFAEEVLLQQRLMTLSAMIENNTLSVLQEGIEGIKLSGNVTADIVLDAKENTAVESTFDFSDLLDAANRFNTPDKVKLRNVLVIYPNYQDALTVDMTFRAEYREVIRGRGEDTKSESDDDVVIHYGTTTTPKQLTLLTVDEFRPKFWTITLNDSSLPSVYIHSPSAGGKGVLFFNSPGMARDFLTWLKAQPLVGNPAEIAIGTAGHKLSLNSGNFSNAALANLQVGIKQ